MGEASPYDRTVEDALRPGAWDWNIGDDVVTGDQRLAELFGLDPRSVHNGVPLDRMLNIVHEEDRADMYISLARSIEFCAEFEATYRVKVDQTTRWIHAVGRCYQNNADKRHIGVALDITQLRTSRRQDSRLRLDNIAQLCLSAYRLARSGHLAEISDALAIALRKVGAELAKAVPRQ